MGDTRRSTDRGAPAADDGPGFSAAAERISDPCYALDTDLAYTYVSDRVRTLLEQHCGDGGEKRDDDDASAATEAADEGTQETAGTTATAPDRLDALFRDAHERANERGEPLTAAAFDEPTDTWIEARCYPDETGMTVLCREISGRRERERELEADVGRLRAIFENAHDAIVVGNEREITAANPAATDLFGLEYAALTGRSLKEFIGDDHDIGSNWDEFVERGRHRGSFSVSRPDGSERIVEYTAVANVLPDTHLAILRDVTEARLRERELEAQRARLAALNHVNGVVREINDAIVSGSTRAQLEAAACESLADSPSYEFAFVADADARAQTITHRVEAGVDGYVDSIPLSIDPDDPAGRGPAGTAIRTGEVQVSPDVFADPDFEPWRTDARERGYRAAAAIPITHDGALYGVLGVTSARRNAFTDEERDVVGQLGEILGHAIAAVERKRVLLGDELTELELVLEDAVEMVDGPEMDDHTIQFDRVVRVDDDRYLEFGTTAVETIPRLESLVECVPHWEDLDVVERSAGDVTFELTIDSPPLFGTIDAHGGYVEAAALRGGDYTVTVHLPRGTDVRDVVDEITAVYPDARTVARRQLAAAPESLEQVRTRLSDSLTDRQRTALELAYYGGYFAWPRSNSGEDLADSMNVSPPTFHEHLREAQRKLTAAFIDGSQPAATTDGE